MYYLNPNDLSTDGSRSAQKGREDIEMSGVYDLQPLHQSSFSTAIPISTKEEDCKAPISEAESEAVSMLQAGKSLGAACTMDTATLVRLLSQSSRDPISVPDSGVSGSCQQYQASFSADPTFLEVHSKQRFVANSLTDHIGDTAASSPPTTLDPLATSYGVVCPRSSVLSHHTLSTPEMADYNRDLQGCEVNAATTALVAHCSSVSHSSSPRVSDTRANVHPMTVGNGNHDPIASLTLSKGPIYNIAGTTTTAPSLAASMASIFFPPSASALHQKRRKAKKHAVRVPRPKNSFMHYRSDVSSMIMIELGMINNKIISKIAAERWNAESEPVKAWYRLKAKRCKEEHAKNYPGYKYAPNKKPTVVPSLHTHISGEEKDMHSGYSKHFTRDPTGQQQLDLQRKPTLGKTANKSYCRQRADAENLHRGSALPMGSQGLGSPNVSLPSSGFPLIEQQLYLAMQQNDHQRLLQQQQMFYSDYHQTLVDPVHHWMTGQQMNPSCVMNHLGFSGKGPLVMDKAILCETFHSMVKEEPPLLHEARMSPNDPNLILSQLYSEYNPNGSWVSSLQDIPPHLMTVKEPVLQTPLMNMSQNGITAGVPWSLSVQQQEQQQDQDQERLIKPVCPMFMSIADVGQGSFPIMDMLSWPNE